MIDRAAFGRPRFARSTGRAGSTEVGTVGRRKYTDAPCVTDWVVRNSKARLDGDRGSALMLMPAAIVIMLVLASICVDLSVVHLGKRNLVEVADSAANDAVTFGLDSAAVRSSGTFTLDESRVAEAVERSIHANDLSGSISDPVIELGPGPDQVTVSLEMHVDYVFAKALPGSADGAIVGARATATAARR